MFPICKSCGRKVPKSWAFQQNCMHWVFDQLNCFLIYICSWCKSLLSVTAVPVSAPISKKYKFTISRTKLTMVKPLWQCLWQLLVYGNMKYVCRFHVFCFLFRQITSTINNCNVTFFSYLL